MLTRPGLRRWVDVFRRASWVVGDQALISGTNFLGMVIAARALSTEDFGLYALAFTGMYAANNLQSALVTQPHGVLAAGRDAEGYRRYTSSTAAMQAMLAGAIAVPLLVAGLLVGLDGAGAILVAVALTIVLWQASEFVRRVLYFERQLAAAFAVDAISYGGQLAGISVLAATGSLTVVSALLVAGITSGASALLGLVLIRGSLGVRPSRAAFAENITYGKWLIGSEVGAFLCLSSYPFLLTAFRGPEDAAVLAAANLILNPLNVMWFAIGTAVPIRLARARAEHGDHVAHRELRTLYLASAPLVAGYCLLVSIFAAPILDFLFGGVYPTFAWVVGLSAAFRFLVYHAHLLSVGLRARHQTRDVFVGYAIATPFSLTVGTLLTYSFGLAGALVAMLGAGTLWTASWARAYFRATPAALATTDR